MVANGRQSAARRLAAGLLGSLVPLIAGAQTVVIGANDAAVDVPAVQAAVAPVDLG